MPLTSLYTCIAILAGLSVLVLAGSLLVVTLARKTSFAWINTLFTAGALALAVEFLSEIGVPNPDAAELTTRLVIACCLIGTAILTVLRSRKITRRRGYDALNIANQHLAFRKRLFETFMNELPGAAIILDEQGSTVFSNQKFFDYFSVDASRVIGKRYEDWLPEETANALRHNDNKVLASQAQHQFIEQITFGGKTSTWLTIKFPLSGPAHQKLLGVIAMEVTEMLKTRTLDRRLASIVKLCPDAVYTLDNRGSITSWNPGAQKMFGYTPDEIIGKDACVLLPDRLKQEARNWQKRLKAGGVIVDLETVLVTRDGTHKQVLLSLFQLTSGSPDESQFAAITRDITQLKQAEERISSLNQTLHARHNDLAEANEALQIARDQALEASYLKSAFVANISHELRTPLSGILGWTELLMQRTLNTSTREMVSTIYESAQTLLHIVNDILDLSSIESGSVKISSQPFSPREIADDCLKLLSPAAKAKELEFELCIADNVPSKVSGDGLRIRQVLLNLIGNAIKFTTSGKVTLELTCAPSSKQPGICLDFCVRDTGIGISAEEQAHLFTPFSRADKSVRGIEGTGLGLVLSKRFVELMGGRMTVQSEKGKGSKFCFSLDFEECPSSEILSAEGALPPSVAPGAWLKYSVLSVEDNPMIRELIMRQLAMIGIQADCAEDGKTALAKLRSKNYDIVLLDINLPDISGYEVAEQIRVMEKTGQTNLHRIVALTAGAMAGDREKAVASGMDDYVAKPVTLAQLRMKLGEWLPKTDRVGAA